MSIVTATLYGSIAFMAFLTICICVAAFSDGPKKSAATWKAAYEARDNDYNQLMALHRDLAASYTALSGRKTTTE